MIKNCNRLGVGLVALFVLSMGLSSAIAQNGVCILPTAGAGWGPMAAALDPVTDDIMIAGAGITTWSEFVASSVSYGGTVNKSFGGGLVATNVAGKNAPSNWPYACAVDGSGKFLSAGFYTTSTGADAFAIVRYNTNGSLDTSFNKTGIVKTSFSFNYAQIRAIALQSDGKIVVAGSGNNGNNLVIVARYTAAGQLDTTFGSNGTVTTTLPAPNSVEAIALQTSNGTLARIVVGAIFQNASGQQSMALIGYTPSGKLDTTFGTSGGTETFNVPGENSRLFGIAVDPLDNSIIAVGDSHGSGTPSELTIACFTASGGLDTTFGTGGYVTESFATSGCAVALDSSGNIVVSGVAANGNLLIARFGETGALDTTFGPNNQGYADDFDYSPEGVRDSVLIQSDGKIVAVGQDANGVTAVVRYNANGSVDTTF